MTIEVRTIEDEVEWLEWRQVDITASVAAALLGCHPYATAYALWVEKLAKLAPATKADNPVLARGTELQPVAVRRIANLRPTWRLEEPKKYYRDPDARLGATPDLFAWDPERPGFGNIQIKTASNGSFKRNWHDEDGELSAPMYAVVQAAIEAHLTGASWCMVAVLVVDWGIDLHLIDIPLVPDLIERVVTETRDFWRQVDTKSPPPLDWKKDAKLLEALYPATPEPIDLTGRNDLPELFDARIKKGIEARKLEDERSEIKTQLLDAMGGAASARLADGRVLTARRINKAAYSVQPSSYIDLRSRQAKGS